MAKKGGTTGNTTLPFATAFLLCEKVLVEKDEVVSAIRIVDRVTISPDTKVEAGTGVAFPSLGLLLITKSGDARGEREVKLSLITPEPVAHTIGTWRVEYTEPSYTGQNLRVEPLAIIWAGEGLYTFEVTIGGKRIARTDLLVLLPEQSSKAGKKER